MKIHGLGLEEGQIGFTELRLLRSDCGPTVDWLRRRCSKAAHKASLKVKNRRNSLSLSRVPEYPWFTKVFKKKRKKKKWKI